MRERIGNLWLACAAGALGALAAWPGWQQWVELCGVHIPTSDVLTDYGAGLAWAAALLLLLLALPLAPVDKRLLAVGWIVKCFVALVFMLPYEEHYFGLDCWSYFRLAHNEGAYLAREALRGGSDTIIGLTGLLIRLGPDSYHATKLTFAMLGLVAVFLFYRAAVRLIGRDRPLAFAALLLYPSVLFWSSILGKDPVVLLGIAIYAWGVVHMAVRRSSRYVVAVLCGIALASAIRIWLGPILLAPCLLVIVSRVRGLAWRVVALGILLAGIILLGAATLERFALSEASDVLEATRTVTDGWQSANSALDRQWEWNSLQDVLYFLPFGLFDTFFRPLPGDVRNVFGWLAGFENLGLLLASAWAALRFRFSMLREAVFLWGVLLLLSWGSAYSFITYRDLGTAVRFKLQVLPVMLGLIGFLLRAPARARPGAVRRPLAEAA
jgi:hypothetical protein